MTSHSRKALRRHPSPTTFERERFEVGHILFEVIDHPKHGPTFAIRPTMKPDAPPLFSGVVERGMGAAMRRLAHRFDEVEK